MAERHKKTGAILRDDKGMLIPRTSHSLNPVPLHVVLNDADRARFVMNQIDQASLANLASTSLHLLGFEAPADYRDSLIQAVR
jgi:2,3-bisphosphoglycerate-independent phosphoglycerate mutase